MDFTKFLNESKWKQLKPSDVEVKEDGRTLIRAPKGMYLRLTIIITKYKDKYSVSFTDHLWEKYGYFFLDKMFNFDEESYHDDVPFDVDEQYQKFFKSAKLNAAYNVYVKNSDIYNLNKEFFTVLIRG